MMNPIANQSFRNELSNGKLLALYEDTDIVCLRNAADPPYLGISMVKDKERLSLSISRPAPNLLQAQWKEPDETDLFRKKSAMISDCMDETYPILVRTVQSGSDEIRVQFTFASMVQTYYYASCGPFHVPVSMLLFLLPEGSQIDHFSGTTHECRIYVSFNGETEWNAETGILRIPGDHGTVVITTGLPQEAFRRSAAAIRRAGQTEEGESALWWKYYRKSVALLADMKSDVTNGGSASVIRELLMSVYARRRDGLYLTDADSPVTLVREQMKIAIFLGSLGYTAAVKDMLDALHERYRKDGRMQASVSLSDTRSGAEGYAEYDTALAILRIFLLYADLTEGQEALTPYLSMVSESYILLKGALHHFMLPYSGHEPALLNRPFDVRFRGSATATMELVACMKRLYRLTAEGRLPYIKKLHFSATLMQRTEDMIRFNFEENGTILPDRGYRDARKPTYVYGTCALCCDNGHPQPYTGWLEQKATGFYACPACYIDRMPDRAGRRPFAKRQDTMLPVLYSFYWSLPVLTQTEKLTQIEKGLPDDGSESLAELSLFFYLMERDEPQQGNRYLSRLVTALEREQQNGKASLGDCAFAGAMIVSAEKKKFPAY